MASTRAAPGGPGPRSGTPRWSAHLGQWTAEVRTQAAGPGRSDTELRSPGLPSGGGRLRHGCHRPDPGPVEDFPAVLTAAVVLITSVTRSGQKSRSGGRQSRAVWRPSAQMRRRLSRSSWTVVSADPAHRAGLATTGAHRRRPGQRRFAARNARAYSPPPSSSEAPPTSPRVGGGRRDGGAPGQHAQGLPPGDPAPHPLLAP